MGNTGAGKSTLLNALLDETRVLPTNGMRACTASLIEMRHEASDPATQPLYRAEVEFLSRAEWEKELPNLLDDLTPTDGPNAGRVAISEVQPDNPAYDSWCRVYAVYGDVFKHSRERSDERGPDGKALYKNPTLAAMQAKLAGTRNITHALGTVKQVSADDAGAFRRQLETYMDSKSELVTCTRGCPLGPFGRTNCTCGSYWPIVKQARAWPRRARCLCAACLRVRVHVHVHVHVHVRCVCVCVRAARTCARACAHQVHVHTRCASTRAGGRCSRRGRCSSTRRACTTTTRRATAWSSASSRRRTPCGSSRTSCARSTTRRPRTCWASSSAGRC